MGLGICRGKKTFHLRRERQIGVRAGRRALPAKSEAGCYGILLRIKAPTESATITRAPLWATQGSANAKTAAINDNGCMIGLSSQQPTQKTSHSSFGQCLAARLHLNSHISKTKFTRKRDA